MKKRIRDWLWDVVALASIVAIVYGSYEIIAVRGWGVGLPLGVLSAILGYLAFGLLAPMWFGRR